MSLKDSVPELSDASEPSDEEFAAWCRHPVTRYVATAFKIMAEEEKQVWTNTVWNNAGSEFELHATLISAKSRARAYEIFISAKKEHYVRTNARTAQKPR